MSTQQTSTKAQSKLIALFASDIHLCPSLPKTTAAFLDFLTQQATQAEQLYLLGDLFEYWAGDDDLGFPYHAEIVRALRAVNDAGTKIFWIAGNRDFLVGEQFADATGVQQLPDPSIINVVNRRIVIAHGDAQCTDDLSYMQFRSMVRQEQWQADFLALPLVQRKAIIENMRLNSQKEQKEKTMEIMDVNPGAITKLFTDNDTEIIIHGHTHRPALHQQTEGIRYVLPDWECDLEGKNIRGGWLEIYDDGEILFHHLDGRFSKAFN